jgi:GAF domain-containing protein
VLVAKEIVSDEKDKPVLNEEILAKLLEAAWVLQEHNRAQQKVDLSLEMHSEQLREREQANRIAATPTTPFTENGSSASAAAAPAHASAISEDYTSTLAQIVETQHQVQLRQLDLESALEMVLDRLIDITHASGAAVGVVDGKIVRYRAGIGPAALLHGTDVEKERALCFDCLRTGQVTRCPDITSEFLLDVNECRRRGIQALIAVPVYHDGGIAGALELYFAHANGFRDADVHSCQLMAGLVTEALARDEEMTWKKSLAEERSVMLDALEKIKPNLAAMVADAGTSAVGVEAPSEDSSSQSAICSSCGAELVAGEQYCGTCGSPRAPEEPSLQSKLGAFLNAHPEEKDKPHSTAIVSDYQHKDPHFLQDDPFAPSTRQSLPAEKQVASVDESRAAQEVHDPLGKEDGKSSEAVSATAPETKEDHAAWTSAAKAKDFLEQMAAAQKESPFGRFWSARRGDLYLAVAVILVAIVIRWGIWSERSVAAIGANGTPTTTAEGARHPQPDANADLSLFDKMLISLGLADAPDVPQNKGNPDTQVWVDLHTALYYCPGSDLYGKTPKGRYVSQRAAQLDQFEPAYRKACD